MIFFQPLSREQKINLSAKILLVGFIFAVVYHFIINGILLQKNYPYNTFLFRPLDRYNDLFGGYSHCEDSPFAPYKQGQMRALPPFLYLIFCFFSLIDRSTLLYFFIGLSVIIYIFITYENLKMKSSRLSVFYTLIFTLCSYPLIFTLDRANLEILVFFSLYFFVRFINLNKFTLSSVFLALAIAMKLFPAVFIVMLFKKKRFKEVIYTILLVAILTVIALVTLKGGLVNNINVMRSGLDMYHLEYAIKNAGLPFGHSLFGLIKLFIITLYGNLTTKSLQIISLIFKNFYYLSSFINIILITYILFIEKKLWKVVTLLVVSIDLLTFVSGDYKLMHFLIPLFLFINEKEKNKYDFIYLILFSLILIPKSYIYGGNSDVSISVIINPVLMIILAVLIVFNGFRQKVKLAIMHLTSNK